ncbi:MAG: YfhO family protein [Elusimicrobia bacterium]|nr:YfhO family protein [Elusimicrobiota bacterium]
MKKNIYILLFFIFLTFIFFPKIFLMTHVPITPGPGGSDITDLNFPYRYLLSQSVKNFKTSTWSDLVWCGYPLHAEGQGGFFYPLNILIFLIFPSDIGFNLSIILNFILCCFFSFLFFKELGLKNQTAVFSASIFSFSGFFLCHIIHLNMLNTVIWFPLILYFTEKFLKTGRFINIAASGISLGIQILAGFPQFVYYTIVITFAYLIFTKNSQSFIKKTCAFGIFVIIGLGFSAIQWLPTLELVGFTSRKAGFAKEPARWWWAYGFSDLITWINPFKYGLPFNNSYNKHHSIFIENSFFIGKIALLIGLSGFILKFRKYKFFAFTAILTFIIALSPSLKITPFLDKIPGFEQFRLHQRTLIFAVFSFSLFWGVIIDKWSRKNGINILLFIIIILELFGFAKKQNAFYKRTDWMDIPPIVDFFKNDNSRYRVWTINSYDRAVSAAGGFSGDLTPYFNYRNFLQPNSNILWNIPAIEGHGGLRPKKFYEIWDVMMQKGIGFETLRFIGLAGGKYVITNYDLSIPYLSLKKDFYFYGNLSPIKIYENKLFYRTVLFINSAVVLPENDIIEQLFDKNFSPIRTVILEETPLKTRYTGLGRVIMKKHSESEVVVESDSENGGFLVLMDTFYPGWRAFVDGRETKIYRADYIFRAVEIPSGKHTVRFIYKPRYFTVGKTVSIITIFCLIFILIFGKIKKYEFK